MQNFKTLSSYFFVFTSRGILAFAASTLFAFAVASCGGSSAEEEPRDCKAGEPRAIFKAEDQGVYEHKFLPDGQFSQEFIRFENDELLTIMQSGCDTLVQTFELQVPDSVQTWPSFRRVLAKRLYNYAGLDPRLYSFKMYSDFLDVIPDEFPLAQPVERAPGLVIRFFKVPATGPTTWQIVYEQDLTQVK